MKAKKKKSQTSKFQVQNETIQVSLPLIENKMEMQV